MTKLAINSLEPLTNKPSKERGYPDKYVPADADKDEYMCTKQLAYFRDLLLTWRKELVDGNTETIQDLKENSTIEADLTDQATIEYEQTLELRTRDRARKVINKIDEALERIRTGEFGFCEETGDPIGIGRLLARPIATLSIEAKRRQERKEVSYVG
jgi:DnaK suppressor protein